MSTWKYNRRYAKAPSVERFDDPNIATRIEVLCKNGLTAWETTFCQSIGESFKKYKSLTKGQYDTLVKIETHYTPEVIAAASQWKSNFTEEMRDNWKAVVEYYETTPYYGNVVKKTKENPEYIPSEAEYKSVVENKYASRYLANRKIAPKHKIGEMVILKQWGSYRLATVTSIHTKLSNWSKGSRIYDVLIVGEASPISVYEKDLLFYRNSMSDKIMLKTEELPF